MGMISWNGSFESLIDSVERAAKVYQEKGMKIVKEEYAKAIKDTYEEFGRYQEMIIEEIFNNAVNQFYTSYTPDFYDRTRGLYDVLDLIIDKRGIVLTGMDNMLLFDRDKMHGDRKGGDLFHKVFIEGWHGGAESSYRGDHPESGTPYYRKPYRYYTQWGKRAKRTESPYQIINQELEVGSVPIMQARLQQILEDNVSIAERRMKNRVRALQRELFE